MVRFAHDVAMEQHPSKILSVVFYRTQSGKEPVRDWMLKLEKHDRYVLGVDLKTVEYGWPLGMPLVRSVKNYERLWEVRSEISGNRITRVLFTVYDRKMVLLHAFIKKTQKTPKPDLELAVDRKRSLARGN